MYQKLVAVTALIHVVNFAVIWGWTAADGGDVTYNIHLTYGRWSQKPCVPPEPLVTHLVMRNDRENYVCSAIDPEPRAKLSLQALVLGFSAISAVAQIAGLAMGKEYLQFTREKNIHILTFLEYSISASLMCVAIGLVLGIDNTSTLLGMAILVWGGCFMGILADVSLYQHRFEFQNRQFMRVNSKRALSVIRASNMPCHVQFVVQNAMWIAHLAGWVLMAIPWVIIRSAYVQASSVTSPPDFVNVIVVSMFLLFICFGAVQFLDLLMFTCGERLCALKEGSCVPSAVVYVVLSAVAKTLLTYLVAANLLV